MKEFSQKEKFWFCVCGVFFIFIFSSLELITYLSENKATISVMWQYF